MSLESHLELLIKQPDFKQEDHINTILKFAINGLENIYKEPYNDNSVRVQLKLKEIELNLEKKKELLNRISRIEEKVKDEVLTDSPSKRNGAPVLQ